MVAGRHLGFFMNKYVNYQVQDYVKFLDPKNVSKDTKIISVAHFLEKLLKIRDTAAILDAILNCRVTAAC